MDTPDFSNILGQETIKKIYEDGLSNPTKEVGKTATDLVKAARLFTAPIQLLAAYQDRLEKYLNQVREAVPEERQIESPASIAGPVLEKLKYIEDENYLKDLYLNLLKKAIDREKINEAHPAFVSIIEQLSPDEALIIKVVAEQRIYYKAKFFTIIEVGDTSKEDIVENLFPLEQLTFPQHFNMYILHLIYLNLIDTPIFQQTEPDESHEQKPVINSRYIRLTEFGVLFHKACIV
ncbi:DUF4393 domain-containing protein [Pontibacter harenae]|uniref:DUF4393 domain-containing protein n=1 Tax=Pontibacter harenae TaxID=2894083 RepID=UPI001E64AAE4|nr:DUF4393 domain-containing protein [Pontibacter harenae]MCC9168844.1 DUF4393 domain-containing protein [Pontibacter harenae]